MNKSTKILGKRTRKQTNLNQKILKLQNLNTNTLSKIMDLRSRINLAQTYHLCQEFINIGNEIANKDSI